MWVMLSVRRVSIQFQLRRGRSYVNAPPFSTFVSANSDQISYRAIVPLPKPSRKEKEGASTEVESYATPIIAET